MSCASAVDSSRALTLASPPARNDSMLAACCARALHRVKAHVSQLSPHVWAFQLRTLCGHKTLLRHPQLPKPSQPRPHATLVLCA